MQRFDPSASLIIVPTEIVGSVGTALVRLALDTGASRTLVSSAILVAIGCDPALAPDRKQITTASGVDFVPMVSVHSLLALGLRRDDHQVLSHTLPPSATIDGTAGP